MSDDNQTKIFFVKNLTFRQNSALRSIALRIVIATLAVAVAVWLFSLGAAHSRTLSADKPATGDRPKFFPVVRIAAQDQYQRVVEYTGRAHARQRSSLSFQRDGKIIQLLVDDGDRVTQGQVLAQLDRRQLNAQAAALEARLKQANAELEELRQGPRKESIATARSNVEDLQQQVKGQQLLLQRSEKLVAANAVAQQDYEQVLYATRALEAKLSSAQSQLDELLAGTRPEQITAQEALVASIEADVQRIQHDLEDCRLTAPFDGTVVRRFVDVGTVISPSVPIFELLDDGHLEVHVGLPTFQAARVAVHDRFDVAINGHEVTATVRAVLPIIDEKSRTQKAILDLVDAGGSYPVAGQSVRVRVVEQTDVEGFWIPARAIASDQRGLWTCYVIQPAHDQSDTLGQGHGTARRHAVEVLYQEQERVFVRGTLLDGSLLVSDGLHRISADQEVQYRVVELENMDADGRP